MNHLVEQISREAERRIISVVIEDEAGGIWALHGSPDLYVTYKALGEELPKQVENVEKALEKISAVPESTLKGILKVIEDDNARYLRAKVRLLKIAYSITDDESQLMKLVSVIDQICVSHKYVGFGNRYYTAEGVHYRLVDKTGWGTSGDELFLQKVIAIYDNITFHSYPNDTEENFLREILCDYLKKGSRKRLRKRS